MARADVPGLVHAWLIRNVEDPRHFVSLALWSDAGSRRAWKQHERSAEHMGACRALCEEMVGSDFELAVEVS
jgi:heme-degrading monooxygenase HmoA